MTKPELDQALIDAQLRPMDLRAARKFKAANWYSPGRELAASLRLRTSEAVPLVLQPKFQIDTDSRVFTIGSCFARNVEAALLERGVRVPALDCEGVDASWLARPSTEANGFLNKYNVHSMLSELEVSLGEESEASAGLIELDDGTWYNPLTHNVKTLSSEEAFILRERMTRIYRKLVDCELVVVTFGLNEVWVDTEAGVFLNGAPLPLLLKRYPSRYAFFSAGPEACLEAARRMLGIMRRAAGPGLKVLVTVSPVPMGRTFTNSDVIIANTYSKSTLRVAAQRLAEGDPLVDYFPSYEMAMLSAPEFVWEPDRAHVRREMVAQIMDAFVDAYVAGKQSS